MDRLIEAVGQRFIMVLGGDGTMLRAIHTHYPDHLPFVGVNFGTKGFLLNNQDWMANATEFQEREYPLLEVDVQHRGAEHQAIAFNEVQVKSTSGGMIDIDFFIGNRVMQNVQGDGLLVVTPAGSTGYNSSAGGPILPHDSKHGVLTPLIPWSPRNMRPIPYNLREEILIQNHVERSRKLSIYADSVDVLENITDPITITIRESATRVRLLIAREYIEEWDAKVFAEQGMKVL